MKVLNLLKTKRGRGAKKTPVLASVKRDGNAHSKPIEHVDAKTLKGAIKELVHVESYFALWKREVTGAFHHISKARFHRFCDEFSFRWDRKKTDDGERMVWIIQRIVERILTYKPTVGLCSQTI